MQVRVSSGKQFSVCVSGEGAVNITKVIHAYRNDFGYRDKGLGKTMGFGGSESACQVNINCSLGSSWQDEKGAVLMQLLEDNTRKCTGTLINNYNEDYTPYFLTAFHCGDTSGDDFLSTGEKSDIEDLVFVSGYESLACSPNTNGSTYNSISGSTFRAARWQSDFLLVELSLKPPYYAGWSNIDTAPKVTMIHHPEGNVKKIAPKHKRGGARRSFSTVSCLRTSG